jgi:hypothetical protein
MTALARRDTLLDQFNIFWATGWYWGWPRGPVDAEEYRLLEGSSEMASFTCSRKCGVRDDRARLPSRLHLHGWPLRLPITSVTAITSAGERRSKRMSQSSLILWVEGILRRCLSSRLLKLSGLSVTSFGVVCSGRIASECTAASTQRTGSGGASGRPIKMIGLHWRSAGYLFTKTMVLT